MFRFNIRVYGILIDESRGILVSDELVRGTRFTKFPGGGLEFGEGTRDCLKREFREEMHLEVEVGEHLYTTDFFQRSAFHPEQQIISIYYKVRPLEPIGVRLNTEAFAFNEAELAAHEQKGETECFRFIPLAELSEASVNLPIDKIVVQLLLSQFNSKKSS